MRINNFKGKVIGINRLNNNKEIKNNFNNNKRQKMVMANKVSNNRKL